MDYNNNRKQNQMAKTQFLKNIHPEIRSELAQSDLESLRKDLMMYVADLSDDHIIQCVNHFASQQVLTGNKEKNPLKKWIESTYSWKLHTDK